MDEAVKQVEEARTLAQSGQWRAATEALMAPLARNPDYLPALNLLHDIALAEMQKSGADLLAPLIAAHPEIMSLHSVAIRLCRARGDYVERLGHLEALYAQGVRGDAFYQEYGAMLRDNGRFARALEIAQEGLKKFPGSLNLLKLRAHLYLSLGEREKSLADWQAISTRAPEDDQARLSIGVVKLLMSDIREGFEDYGAHQDRALASLGVELPAREWKGEALHGKRLLLWYSQGIGDVIQFAGLIPWLTRQGAEVTLLLPEKLMPLFARSFPGLRLFVQTPESLLASSRECDFHCLLGQLMALVLPQYRPADHPPYLKADAARVARLRADYVAGAPRKGASKLVGIAWDTQNKDTFSQRNIPLASWAPLFSIPDIQYVSLQYGDHHAAMAEVERTFPGALCRDPAIDPWNDMNGLAAQIAAMDEVVTIDNATVHLAGGLGAKTTLLLSAASDWRWGLKSTATRWYASVTLERQQTLMDWGPALETLRKRLAGQ